MIDRFGPRSTPIRIASTTVCGLCAAWIVELAISPAGRLLTAFDTSATATPATAAATCSPLCISMCSRPASARTAPVRSSVSTTTNSPATSGNTLHEISRTIGTHAARSRIATHATVTTPASAVGNPSGRSATDTAISATAVVAMPASAMRPPRVSGCTGSADSQWPDSARRCTIRSITNVQTIDATDGAAKCASQTPSAGMCAPYSTRFAGFEIGSTKLAALATSAQLYNSGIGSAFARRAAARTAGVSTTAVASLDRNTVVTTPTP